MVCRVDLFRVKKLENFLSETFYNWSSLSLAVAFRVAYESHKPEWGFDENLNEMMSLRAAILF